MSLLRDQSDISHIVPMPTERVDDAATVSTSTTETVTWFYVTSSAWASATGQPAGTLIWGKLTYRNILNSNKAALGSINNTSLSIGASTRLDTFVSVPEEILGKMQYMTPDEQKAAILPYFVTNSAYDSTKGYYTIDHRRGQIWARPKASVANDTATYSYMAKSSGSSDITSVITGTGATNLGKAEDAGHTSGDVGVMSLAVRNDAGTALAGTTLDYIPLTTNSVGGLYTQETLVPNYELQTEGLAATHPAGMATSTKAITRFASTALEASRVIKASAGRLYELMGRVDKTAPTADYWVQILNASSLPADGAVTFLDRFKIVHTNGVDNVFDFTDNFGAYGSSGLVVCLSTTEFTKTISGAYLSITGKYA